MTLPMKINHGRVWSLVPKIVDRRSGYLRRGVVSYCRNAIMMRSTIKETYISIL